MTEEEKKTYIIRNWSLSSGKTITEMLKRYWLGKKDNFEMAKEIFK